MERSRPVQRPLSLSQAHRHLADVGDSDDGESSSYRLCGVVGYLGCFMMGFDFECVLFHMLVERHVWETM